MGIHDHMKKIGRADTIHIGVWTRISGAIRFFCTYSVCHINYQHDRVSHSTGKAKSADDHGGR
jgi:hypothetical protein